MVGSKCGVHTKPTGTCELAAGVGGSISLASISAHSVDMVFKHRHTENKAREKKHSYFLGSSVSARKKG